MKSLSVKKGDTVLVRVGAPEKDGGDRGKRERVIATSPKKGTVIVENVNMQKHHKKARSAQDTGGILEQAGPINASNVQVVCPSCKKPTRVGHKSAADAKGKTVRVRVCKKCGAEIGAAAASGKQKKEKDAKPDKKVKEKKEVKK